MKNIDFFKGFNNPLEESFVLEDIVSDYKNSEVSVCDGEYCNDFYSKLIKHNIENKISGKCDTRYAYAFELYNFNKWKNSILSLSDVDVKTEYQNGIRKLKKFLISFNPLSRAEIRNFLDNYGSDGKIINDLETEKAFDAVRYNRLSENSGWTHVSSRYTNLRQNKDFDIKHRLYINTNSTYTHKLALLFMKKCDEQNIPYYYKLDEYGNRCDTLVIYANNKLLIKYIEILKQIRLENKDLKNNVFVPPILTSKLDGWIGYGSEPSLEINNKRQSFNTLRVRLLNDILDDMMISFIKNNKNYRDKLIDIFTNNLVDEFIKKQVNIVNNYWSNDENFYKYHKFHKKEVNTYEFRDYVTKYVRYNVTLLIDNIDNIDKIEFKKDPKDILEINKYFGYNTLRKNVDVMVKSCKLFSNNFNEFFKKHVYKYNIFDSNIAFDTIYLGQLYDLLEEKDNKQEIKNSSEQANSNTPSTGLYSVEKKDIIQDLPVNFTGTEEEYIRSLKK